MKCDVCGVAIVNGKHCLAHLTAAEFGWVIAQLRRGDALHARCVEFRAGCLTRVLHALRSPEDGIVRLPSCDFTGARFDDGADFSHVQFTGKALFSKSQFKGRSMFEDARFATTPLFKEARFSGDASFDSAIFSAGAVFSAAWFGSEAIFRGTEFRKNDGVFSDAQFSKSANFSEGEFIGAAHFSGVRFSGDALFGDRTFSHDADFSEAQFECRADFAKSRFNRAVFFDDARFSGDSLFTPSRVGAAVFDRALFEKRIRLALVASARLSFDDAEFERDVQIDASTTRLSCQRTRFAGRADLNIRRADVALDGATFAQQARLTGVSELPGLHAAGTAHAKPRVVTLRQANVENLALGNVDLRACRFLGAHRLDQLRIEADCDFAAPPSRWQAQRLTLAEEHQWQCDRQQKRRGRSGRRASRSSWHPEECRLPDWVAPATEMLDPRRIGALYQALRKALEDRKDEPGAAEFYYGEMEMRRHQSWRQGGSVGRVIRGGGEHVLLTLYWLTSGYAQRASRALATLALVIVLFAAMLTIFGFPNAGPTTKAVGVNPSGALVYQRVRSPEQSVATQFLDAAIFSATSAALLSGTERPLTRAGRVLRIALRVLGPILVGLVLLSIRGRVKR